MKKYTLAWMTLLVVAVWVGNYAYYDRHKLAEPVFLDHFYDVTASSGSFLDLYYVTHRDEPRELIMVQPSEDIRWPVQGVSTFGDYGPYRVNKATVQLGRSGDPLPPEAYHVFTELKGWFKQGGGMNGSVGRIILRPPTVQDSLLSGLMSRGSSNGEYEYVMQAKEDLRILTVSHTLEQQLRERLVFSVHKTMSEELGVPMELKQGESVTVEQSFGMEKEAGQEVRMNPVLGELKLELHAVGRPDSWQSWSISGGLGPWPDRKGIKALIERKGGGISDGG
ncbi:hypothetical protein WMW72_22985 [Paenibacillus filicis]|uniref:Uncharacterized protein n=1 Tax=Paenibacillus filicis TaxID=669464 RepID=A0ABU9DPI4_9BACL